MKMRKILLLISFVPTVASAQLMIGQPRAIDGDTFAFGEDMIRIHGIDAVETAQTCGEGNEVWNCGEQATELMRILLRRGGLQCQQMDTDQYGRQVSICRAGGADIGLELVSAGLAVALPQYSDSYITAEERARANGVGIWGSSFQMPSDYRAANPDFEEPRPAPRRIERGFTPDYSPQRQQSQSRNVYYRNCDAARAAGAAPLRRGSPGYRSALDADGDGVACEPYRGRR